MSITTASASPIGDRGAATLSHRYITDRLLPDKAIDLIDEAARLIKMQVDSQAGRARFHRPRESVRLKIEQEALKKESTGSKDRLKRSGRGE